MKKAKNCHILKLQIVFINISQNEMKHDMNNTEKESEPRRWMAYRKKLNLGEGRYPGSGNSLGKHPEV